TFLRGGIGLFSGRPPYTWLGSAYRDEGTQQLFLLCVGAAAPLAFDPVNQPTVCANGAAPTPQLSYFDPNVPFPQSLKLSLGLDHRLPADAVATVDLLYTRAAHQWYYGAANLPAPVGAAQPAEHAPRRYPGRSTLADILFRDPAPPRTERSRTAAVPGPTLPLVRRLVGNAVHVYRDGRCQRRRYRYRAAVLQRHRLCA